MPHKLTLKFMEEFNITEKQATFLMYISRFGFATAQILQLTTVMNGVKDIQGVRTRINQLEKKKLIAKKPASSIPGSEYIAVPTNKVNKALKNSKMSIASRPTGRSQIRHNAIAIAVVIMELSMSDKFSNFMTANTMNSLKLKKKWKGKIPDAICLNPKTGIGRLIEVELSNKAIDKYVKAFKDIKLEDNLKILSNGWDCNMYYVDTDKKKRNLEATIDKLNKKGNSVVKETAEITKVKTLDSLLSEFNTFHGSNLEMKMFKNTL